MMKKSYSLTHFSVIFLTLSCLFFSCCLSLDQTRGGANAPALALYKLDLDLAPNQRWAAITTVYNASIWTTVRTMESWIPAEIREPLVDMLNEIGSDLEGYFPYPYGGEMQGVADTTGVKPGLVVLSNLVYELTSACTSIVAQAQNGTIFHARNLDFGLGAGFTSDLTLDALTVQFVQGGQMVYIGTTYAGYVGLLTGERPGFFSVSVDEHLGPMWEVIFNVVEEIIQHKASMVSFLIRDTLYNSTYETALHAFSYHPLAAEVYLIVGGVSAGQGAVITRMRNYPQNIWKINVAEGRWYVLETNYPHWKPDPPSDDRATVAKQQMDLMGQANLSYDGLWNVLSTTPVLNVETTYTALMYNAPNGPPHYLAYARHCGSGCPE